MTSVLHWSYAIYDFTEKAWVFDASWRADPGGHEVKSQVDGYFKESQEQADWLVGEIAKHYRPEPGEKPKYFVVSKPPNSLVEYPEIAGRAGVELSNEALDVPSAQCQSFQTILERNQRFVGQFAARTRCFVFPAVAGRESVGSVFVVARFDPDNATTLRHDIEAVLWEPLTTILNESFARTKARVLAAWRRSALAAIMSRNVSHNIGSHVLSRLGRAKGGGWYTQRYLQQRMDFLAQIATEWPTWEEPAWFLQDLMRWFLHQQDVLDNIALSEGLRAHRFRQANSAGQASPNPQPAQAAQFAGEIRLHVFLVPEPLWCAGIDSADNPGPDARLRARIDALRKGCEAAARAGEAPGSHLPCSHGAARQADAIACRRVLLYTPQEESQVDGKDAVVRTDQDQLVSIPGGIVGYQAFYVILENVLRNAAKHGQRTNGAPLHIVIEIFYDPNSTLTVRDGEEQEHRRAPCTLVRVYDSASLLEDGKVELWGDDGINARLQADLIDGTGKLRQGNWGLSEMRIAAAFLQRRTIEHVGGGGEMITGPQGNGDVMDGTILASARNGGSPYVLRAIRSPIGTLGYELFLLRPQTLAIVLPETQGSPNGGKQ